MRSALAVLSWLVLAPLAVGLALAFGPSPTRIAAARPLIERDRDYVGSEACRGCHPDQFASWERTYHRTMTQLPEGAAVLGSFDGVAREFFGLAATPFERDGRFWMRLPDADGGAREAEVALCVGSRRYQQYFELAGDEVGGAYRRLPLLWHVAEARWMHLNGVFLGPDEPNWDAHRATWNENCIFCHNTAPVPRVDVTRPPGSRDHCRSRVAELGIACEACHGPGGAHARALAAPNARLAAYMEEHGEHTLDIVNPTRLGQHEALALCGQCHAQRLPKEPGDLARILDQGPSFRPGERLEAHVAPIERTTPSLDPARPELFAQRFWRDGTPRLTAYEYTALLRSPCLAGGEMTCSSCHSMHAGEPEGNLEPELRGDRACTQCHADIARDVRAHTHHDPAQSGARCLECHMPRIVYGVLELHRSHAIEVPDVRRDVEAGRPNTCTGCHLGESADWAAAAMQRLWGPAYARARARPDGASLALAEARASLHAGDAVQRAAAAVAFGREEAVLGASGARGAAADLAVALGDGYPSVRTLARRSLRALDARHGLGLAAELEAFDVFAPLEERRAHVLALLARLEGGRGPALDLERVRALLELQSNQVIAIGE